MARIKIDLPPNLPFETELEVRITDINYGGHLGNHALLGLLHEARLRFLAEKGFSEIDAGGCGTIMSDTAVVFKGEVFHGRRLLVRVAAAEPTRTGCDLYYQVLDAAAGTETARAKTGIVFFDYQSRKMSRMPDPFRQAFFPAS